MPTIMSRRAAPALLAVLCGLSSPRPARAEEGTTPGCVPPCTQRFLLVQRSKNQNEVVYAANVTPSGFHPKVPMFAYWVMKARDGRREELTDLERKKAYGLTFARVDPREVSFSVKALEGLALRAELSEERGGAFVVRAHACVDGQEMPLERVFIATDGGWPVPKIDHIDLFGTLNESGQPVAVRLGSERLRSAQRERDSLAAAR